MKRLLSWILVVSLCMSLGVADVFAARTSYRCGDVDGDTIISTSDAREILLAIVNDSTLSATVREAADYDGNAEINTTDAKEILKLIIDGNPNYDTDINFLPPSADDWLSPVQITSGVKSIVSVSQDSAGAQTFTNICGTWPYAAYVYDQKILVHEESYIEYDLTVRCSATSINFYIGGSIPDLEGDKVMDDVAGRDYFKLNSFISSTNIDPGSGDLTTGTYKGKVKVKDLNLPDDCYVGDMVWFSGLKIYAVGGDKQSVVIRKLSTVGFADPLFGRVSTDPEEAVRANLINTAETEGLSSLVGMELYVNGERSTGSTMIAANDNKKIYNTMLYRRVVNYTNGYRLDVPFDWQEDFSLATLRTRYTNDHYSLTVTRETKNPYYGESGWNTYLTEWLNRYIADSSFLSANNLSYTRTPVTSTSILSGYEVLMYDIVINDNSKIALPYYSIAVVRQQSNYRQFYLLVLKSDARTDTVMEKILRSFVPMTPTGRAVNTQGQYEVTVPTTWSAETKAYYNKLMTQDTTDFGFFSASMVSISDSSYNTQNSKIQSEYDRLSKATGIDYEIMPTYTHLMYGSTYMQFPSTMANKYAGGNGFNGKPVLQFTYQFTSNNNTLNGQTPMYDILRGKHDAQFRQLAKDIKAYGKPVLFRLNNEMNTDWTSYCGMMTLLDPDIFVQTWQRLYDIFEQQGVNNCIWIFNPVATTTPYCSWGEDLCYMPGAEYVHALGLTNYEMGNGTSLSSFKTMYSMVYDKNEPYFSNYPWIISEFAAGAGGQKMFDWSVDQWVDTTLGRNADKQAAWVTDMFACLNNKQAEENAFCRNIKGAVWFSTNDYTYIDSKKYIVNYLELDSSLTDTLAAFKAGFAAR